MEDRTPNLCTANKNKKAKVIHLIYSTMLI